MNRIDIIKNAKGYKKLTKEELLKLNKVKSHTEISKVLRKYGIISNYDYSVGCGINNFTNFYGEKAKKILNKNSKYIIIRPNINGDGNTYLTGNMYEVFNEVNERYIQRAESCYHINKSKRLTGHFLEENVLRFGTKRDDYYNIILKPANLSDLLKKESYLYPQMNHPELQGQILNLAHFLDYISFVANNDHQEEVNDFKMTEIATAQNLLIDDFVDSAIIERVKKVDVIWFPPKNDDRNIRGFEIELSNDWDSVIIRFQNLCEMYKRTTVYCIVVAEIKYFRTVKRHFYNPTYNSNFKNATLKFLPIHSLLEFISKIDLEHSNPRSLQERFDNLLIDLTPLH